MRRAIIWLFVALVGANLAILLSGARLLIAEEIISSKDDGPSGSWGAKKEGYVYFDSEKDALNYTRNRKILVCRYWTGRNIRTVKWEYPEERDECNFIYTMPGN